MPQHGETEEIASGTELWFRRCLVANPFFEFTSQMFYSSVFILCVLLLGCNNATTAPVSKKPPIVTFVDYAADAQFQSQHQVYVFVRGQKFFLPLRVEGQGGGVAGDDFGNFSIEVNQQKIPILVDPPTKMKILSLRTFIMTDATGKKFEQMGNYTQLGPEGTVPVELNDNEFEKRNEAMPLLTLP